jgi:hypothetical protein
MFAQEKVASAAARSGMAGDQDNSSLLPLHRGTAERDTRAGSKIDPSVLT